MTTLNQVTPITINSLPAGTTVTGNEATVCVQGGATVQIPINQYPQGFGGATGSFHSSDGKNVTVVNGIVVGIV